MVSRQCGFDYASVYTNDYMRWLPLIGIYNSATISNKYSIHMWITANYVCNKAAIYHSTAPDRKACKNKSEETSEAKAESMTMPRP